MCAERGENGIKNQPLTARAEAREVAASIELRRYCLDEREVVDISW